jgi:hypothetical protein
VREMTLYSIRSLTLSQWSDLMTGDVMRLRSSRVLTDTPTLAACSAWLAAGLLGRTDICCWDVRHYRTGGGFAYAKAPPITSALEVTQSLCLSQFYVLVLLVIGINL